MIDSIQTFDLEAVWEDLIAQFSDPLSCLRELVQNAIDANSGDIDIDFEFAPVAGDGADRGRMVLHVRDFGEGMDRDLIEGRLTELFSSGKDDDYTKIGRFGIGFVSVFALEPQVVCVDTGRSGEYWRVLFDGDGSFELLELDRPIEGTHVRVVKEVSRAEFAALRGRAARVVRYWCKHARIAVRVGGEDVRTDFAIDSACSVSYREEGTRIVAGLIGAAQAPYGYYNRGLTLEEGDDGPRAFVSFKIDSRYLEHTLTRDQVVEEENFHKAHERLDELIAEDLPEKLLDQLEREAEQGPSRRYDRLVHLLACYLREYGAPPGAWRERPVVAVGDGVATPGECLQAAEAGRLMVYAGEREVTGGQIGSDVLLARASRDAGGLHALFRHLAGGSLPALRSQYAVPERRPPERVGPGASALLDEFERLSGLLDIEFETVAFGRVYRESPLADRVVLPGDDFHRPLRFGAIPSPSRQALVEHDRLLLNLAHPLLEDVLTITEREPEWAAAGLLKLICGSNLTPAEDADLTRAAIRHRDGRRRHHG